MNLSHFLGLPCFFNLVLFVFIAMRNYPGSCGCSWPLPPKSKKSCRFDLLLTSLHQASFLPPPSLSNIYCLTDHAVDSKDHKRLLYFVIWFCGFCRYMDIIYTAWLEESSHNVRDHIDEWNWMSYVYRLFCWLLMFRILEKCMKLFDNLFLYQIAYRFLCTSDLT